VDRAIERLPVDLAERQSRVDGDAVEGTEPCHLFWHGAPAGAPGQTNAHINQSPDSRVDIAGLILREAANRSLARSPPGEYLNPVY